MTAVKFGKRRGFALLLVVVILTVIGLLAESITLMNRIDTLTTAQQYYQQKAQENALFGLGVAIHKIQSLTGPDQRVTACARLIAPANTSVPFYTGVWDSSQDIQFLGWLVSGHFDHIHDLESPIRNAEMIKILSCDGLQDVYISPEKISSEDHFHGRYGYWVSDESQKAKLSLFDTYAFIDNQRSQKLRGICPQTFGIHTLFHLNSPILDNVLLAKIDFPEQLRYIDPNVFETYLRHPHDLTLYSLGVLTDTRHGGLKQDLSMAVPTGPIFKQPTDLPVFIPTFDMLSDFVQLSKINTSGEISPRARTPMYRPQYRKSYDQKDLSDFSSPVTCGVSPVIVQTNILFYPTSIHGKLALAIDPCIVLWNPYNVTLKKQDYILDLCVPDTPSFSLLPNVTLWGKYPLRELPDRIITFSLCSTPNWDHNTFSVLRFKITTQMAPGAVQLFSCHQSEPLSASGNTLSLGVSIGQPIFISTHHDYANASDYKLTPTDKNGALVVGWQCFYLQLKDAHTHATFQEIAELNPVASSTTVSPAPVLSLNFRQKYGHLEDATGETGIRWLALYNPRAQYINRACFNEYSSGIFTSSPTTECPYNMSIDSALSFPDSPSFNICFDEVRYLRGLVLYDIPDAVTGVPNIGFLRHLDFSPFGYFPSLILGTSAIHPMIPPKSHFFCTPVEGGYWPERARTESLCDYAYYLNDVLFDHYFFSTLTIEEDQFKFCNHRFRLLSDITPETAQHCEQQILIDGPFNLHSQQTIPWICALSSLTNSSGRTLFPRTFSPEKIDDYPSFSEKDISELVDRILFYQKSRGPSASLGDFINRSGTEKATIDKAIEDVRLNRSVLKNKITYDRNYKAYNDQYASGYLEEGLPDVINQSDILQLMSHYITMRGDTFLIRVVGEHLSPNGSHVLARAYGEAVIQRYPEYVHPLENGPLDDYNDLSPINQELGRRYRLISFRWIDEP